MTASALMFGSPIPNHDTQGLLLCLFVVSGCILAKKRARRRKEMQPVEAPLPPVLVDHDPMIHPPNRHPPRPLESKEDKEEEYMDQRRIMTNDDEGGEGKKGAQGGEKAAATSDPIMIIHQPEANEPIVRGGGGGKTGSIAAAPPPRPSLPPPLHSPSAIPRSKKVTLSIIACCSYATMGGLMGLLGPAIPSIAQYFHVAETTLGGAFAARAGGYIGGSLLVTKIPERGCISKVGMMGAAGVLASGINMAIPHSEMMAILLPMIFVQGIGLAIISTLGNIVLLEVWERAAGPWLQILHFCFGIGSVLSPLLLGITGMSIAFTVVALVGMLPFFAILFIDWIPALLKRARAKSIDMTIQLLHHHSTGEISKGLAERDELQLQAEDKVHYPMRGNAGGPTAAGASINRDYYIGNESPDISSSNHRPQYLDTSTSLHHTQYLDISGGGLILDGDLSGGSGGGGGSSFPSFSPYSLGSPMKFSSANNTSSRPFALSDALLYQETYLAGTTEATRQQQQHHDHESAGEGGVELAGLNISSNEEAFHSVGRHNHAHSIFQSNTSEITLASTNFRVPAATLTSLALDAGFRGRGNSSSGAAGSGGTRAAAAEDQSVSSCCGRGGGGGGARGSRKRKASSSSLHHGGGYHHHHQHFEPMPTSIRWLLTIFLALYVGAECGFGGWVSTYVLLQGATKSESQAAFLVSIFWAAVTVGRAIAVGQAVFIPPSWSLRIQLLLSIAGGIVFYITGGWSIQFAAASAALYGYGMSSIYPLVMSWPGEAGLGMDTATTAHIAIGGCIGEAVLPVVIGATMQGIGPSALPYSVLGLLGILVLVLPITEILGRKIKRERMAAHDISPLGLEESGRGGRDLIEGGANKGPTAYIEEAEGVWEELAFDNASTADTECGHLSTASIVTPGHPYLLPIF